MNRPLAPYRLSMSLLLAIGLSAPLCVAQEEASADKIPDNPQVEEKLDALADVLKDKKAGRNGGERDDEAVTLIDELVQLAAPGLSKGDRKGMIRGMEKVFRANPVRDPQNLKIYRAAAAALGELGGPESATAMQRVYDAKKPFPDHLDWVNLREALLKSIGRTKSESHAKFLYDEAARHYDNGIKAAAGEALGYFSESPYKLRAEIINKLLIEFGQQESNGTPIDTGNQQAQNARDTLRAISDRWMTTMSKLTGQHFRTYQDWNTWYNKNKHDPKAWGDDGG